jgi:Protein of unknown function (DUF992)
MSWYRSMPVAAFLFVAGGLPLAAQQAGGTKVGVLTCKTSASLGVIIGSHQKLACSFAPSDGGPSDYYTGHVTRLGLDLGVKAAGVMVWGVFAPTSGVHHGALAGTYVGGSGDIALGIGVGAKVLIGGSHRSFALQPLSVEGQVGVNLALGVAGLRLNAAH